MFEKAQNDPRIPKHLKRWGRIAEIFLDRSHGDSIEWLANKYCTDVGTIQYILRAYK